MSNGNCADFHRSGDCGDAAAGVESVSAANTSITVDNSDPANPTIAAGTVPAANVKHRYLEASFRTTNKPASSTTSLLADGDLSAVFPRACRIVAWTYYGSVAGAGSSLLIEISVNGGGAWVTLGSVLVGEVAFVKTITPIAVAAGAEVRVRAVADGSWTATAADPQVRLEVEET